MSVHDAFYISVLTHVIKTNYALLAEGGSLIDEGEGMAPGMYEPYMRTTVVALEVVRDGIKNVGVVFSAGPFKQPHQEYYFYLEEGTDDLKVNTIVEGDEFQLCEIVDYIFHLIIHLQNVKLGIDNHDCEGARPDIVDIPKNNIVRLKPALRVVENDSTSDKQ